MDIERHRLEMADKFPYDGGGIGGRNDWAYRAARGVLADLGDRRGIKWALQDVEGADDNGEIRREMVDTLASIIRQAHEEA